MWYLVQWLLERMQKTREAPTPKLVDCDHPPLCVSRVFRLWSATVCFELWSPTTLYVSREGDHLSDDRFIVWPKPLTSPLSLNSLNFLSHSNVNYCLPVLWLSCTGVGGWGNKKYKYLFKLFILSGDPNVSGMAQFLIVNVFSRDFELIGW